MATTAQLNFNSDITDDSLNVTTGAKPLYLAGGTTDVNTLTSVTKTLESTDHVDLIATGTVSTTHAYVYIKNKSEDASEFFHIHIGNAVGSGTYDDGTLPTEEIGRLYAGDFMWFPWDVDDDITIKPSVATKMTVEYMVFS